MPRRSRGCAACRQRRIGCDGALPSCHQCRAAKRPCSGPVQGPIVINQSAAVASRCQRAVPSRPRPGIVVTRQPSTRSISAVAFICEFVSFITARNEQLRRTSWLSELQSGSIDDNGLALDLSMQATALAYCGMASKNPAALREACNVYCAALSRYSTSISRASGSPRAATVCTSIMLSLFEAVYSTTHVAYATHLGAARKMLTLVQPQHLREHQVLWQLAKHVQCQTLFVMVASPHEYLSTMPANRAWIETCPSQFADAEQIFDRLLVEVFILADSFCLQVCLVEDSALCDRLVRQRVNTLEHEFYQKAAERGEKVQWEDQGAVHYRDAFTAMTVAYFAAANVLLALHGFSASADDPRDLAHACDTILWCSRFLQGQLIGCACLRMFFPLTLVALYGTQEHHRAGARGYLVNWLSEESFTGLGSIAVKRIDSSEFGSIVIPQGAARLPELAV